MQVWLSHINQEKHSGVVAQLWKLSVSVFIAISVNDTLLFNRLPSSSDKSSIDTPTPPLFFILKLKLNLKAGWYLIVLLSLWISNYVKRTSPTIRWLACGILSNRSSFPNIIKQLYVRTTIRKKIGGKRTCKMVCEMSSIKIFKPHLIFQFRA